MDNGKLSEFIHSSLVTATQIAYIDKAGNTMGFLKQLDEVLQFLNKDQNTVTLFDELKAFEKYLSIQKTRYGNRYNLLFSYEEDFKNVFITRSTLISFLDSILRDSLGKYEGNINILIEFGNANGNMCIIVMIDSRGIKERYTQILE